MVINNSYYLLLGITQHMHVNLEASRDSLYWITHWCDTKKCNLPLSKNLKNPTLWIKWKGWMYHDMYQDLVWLIAFTESKVHFRTLTMVEVSLDHVPWKHSDETLILQKTFIFNASTILNGGFAFRCHK